MNLKKNLLRSLVFTVATVLIGLSSVIGADRRHRADQRS